MRSQIRNSGTLIAITAPLLIVMFGPVAEASSKKAAATEILKQTTKKKAGSVQLVTFPDTGWSPVRIVRGKTPAKSSDTPTLEAEKAETAETITFDDSRHSSVRVIRGESDRAAMGQPRAGGMNLEVVSFADPRERPVSILRGSGPHPPDFDLFGPASVADLDRVAFAVDGAESRHGVDLRMWRDELLTEGSNPAPSSGESSANLTSSHRAAVGGRPFDAPEHRARCHRPGSYSAAASTGAKGSRSD
jgi:hypothetical protein